MPISSGAGAPAGAVADVDAEGQQEGQHERRETEEEASQKRAGSEAAGSSKRPRTESWTARLEYQNRFGHRRFSLSENDGNAAAAARGGGISIDVATSDDAYVPFKVRREKNGEELEMNVVVSERLISAVEEIEDFAKKQTLANSSEWLGRPMGREEIDATFRSSLKRHDQYPTKLKGHARPPTVFSYTTREGETSAGQGIGFLDELIKTRNGLQGLALTGKLSPTIWTSSSKAAWGVLFRYETANLSERNKRKEENEKSRLLEDFVLTPLRERESKSAPRGTP